MIYLNVILTILCLILLSFLVLSILLFRKYSKKLGNLGKITSVSIETSPFSQLNQFEDGMKIISKLMNNLPKK